MTSTITCTRALCDLLDTTRSLTERAQRMGAPTKALRSVAQTIDATRTRLVEDGVDYLDAAWAFLKAGRRVVADEAMKLDARELVHP